MTSKGAFYRFLDEYKGKWSSEESDAYSGETCNILKKILEDDPYLLHEVKTHQYGATALQEILRVDKLSTPSIVNLMLSYGADVNCANFEGTTPLLTALQRERGVDVIRALVEKGANVNATEVYGRNALCFALNNNVSVDIVQILLDAGCSLDSCTFHGGFALSCATWPKLTYSSVTDRLVNTNREFTEKAIRLLIENGAHLNAINDKGCSPLCCVLRNAAELWVIDLLVAAGGSLNACTKHASPLQCVTSNRLKDELEFEPFLAKYPPCPIRVDVAKRLLKWAEDNDPVQLTDPTPLQNALKYSDFEDELTKLLSDHPQGSHDVADDSGDTLIKLLSDHLQGSHDVTDDSGDSLLHLAVSGSGFCKPSRLQFLMKRGATVDRVNKKGETALHLAVTTYGAQLSIVKILLEAGSSVNTKNADGDNPLQMKVKCMEGHLTRREWMGEKHTEDIDILKMLFIAGSRIGCSAVRSFVSKLDQFNREYTGNREFEYCKMLVKCHFLEDSDFCIEHLIEDPYNYAVLSAFGASCKRELKGMKSMIVSKGRTLRDLLVDPSSHPVAAGAEEFDFNQLEIIADGAFPVYFDIIATKIVGRLSIEEILREVHVYTAKSISGQKEIITLNHKLVCRIADHLTDEDLWRFIVAFRKMDHGMCTVQAGNEHTLEEKRVKMHPTSTLGDFFRKWRKSIKYSKNRSTRKD